MGPMVLGIAVAGYGDAIDGRPSHPEREAHFWTNAVRVDPSAFIDDYPCSFNGFAANEKTPKAPLQWNHDLGEAARVHSADMNDRGYFSHDTQGGPSFSQRVWSYYDGGAIGENIAQGYSSAWSAVISGWMCSSGHRANILSTQFDELGVGIDGSYYTQDFGGGSPPARALAMGIHLPREPNGTVDFGVDWTMATKADRVEVVVDGEAYPMSVLIGDPSGWAVYSTRLSLSPGCHEYYFLGSAGGLTHAFPQDGSYTFGGCDNDDPEAAWVERQLSSDPPATDADDDTAGEVDDAGDDDDDDDDGPSDDDDDDDDDDGYAATEPTRAGGCATAPSLGVSGWVAWLGFALRRRRAAAALRSDARG